MRNKPTHILLRYGAAIGAVGLAVLLKLPLFPYLTHEAPFLLLLSAVMAAAWYGGLGPGLLATALGTLSGLFFFRQFPLASGFTREHEVRMALFLAESIVISVLAGTLHSARRRAEHNAAVARELEHTLAEVSEAEQRRIGHDLHDGLGQHLTGIALLGKALQQRLALAGRAEAADAGEIAELANESIDWTRDLARGLAPVDLDRFTLPAALRGLASKTERLCKVRCTYEGTDDLILPDETTTLNLYRVAQEAVNNAVKHARPRHVWITLTDGGRVVLTVRDDGAGMSWPAPGGNGSGRNGNHGGGGHAPESRLAGHRGMGLRIMRYRATVVGARLEIHSTPGEGTAVTCVLPDPDAGDEERDGKGDGEGSERVGTTQ